MIGIVQFLKASGIEVDATDLKIHLACWNGKTHPIDEYYAGNFQRWQEWQTRRNFNCAQVLGLIDLGQGDWLFAGVSVILGCKPNPKDLKHYLYSTRLLPNQEELIGRITVHHQRTRATYIWSKPEVPLPIVEIRREKLTIGEFPGYNAVVLSHGDLKVVTGQNVASWHGALANIKGIYLIADTTTGKHYVGKASGSVGIWQRWCSYAENGHGGNVELKRLLQQNGSEHTSHFQYSILEIADTHASEEDILRRESHWVSVLKSRAFGLNGSRRTTRKNP